MIGLARPHALLNDFIGCHLTACAIIPPYLWGTGAKTLVTTKPEAALVKVSEEGTGLAQHSHTHTPLLGHLLYPAVWGTTKRKLCTCSLQMFNFLL